MDGRADQYSLGCVLYECLTGRLPFQKDRDAAIIWAHVEDLPPLPSNVRPDLPASHRRGLRPGPGEEGRRPVPDLP